jgi:hypothetical protein
MYNFQEEIIIRISHQLIHAYTHSLTIKEFTLDVSSLVFLSGAFLTTVRTNFNHFVPAVRLRAAFLPSVRTRFKSLRHCVPVCLFDALAGLR